MSTDMLHPLLHCLVRCLFFSHQLLLAPSQGRWTGLRERGTNAWCAGMIPQMISSPSLIMFCMLVAYMLIFTFLKKTVTSFNLYYFLTPNISTLRASTYGFGEGTHIRSIYTSVMLITV